MGPQISTATASRQVLLAAFLLFVGSSTPLPAGAQESQPAATQPVETPVQIDSDELEVDQAAQVAIFTGNVDAKQKDMRLRSDRLVVNYEEEEVSEGDQPSQRITQLEATGHVVITRPEEEARGDWAVHQVDADRITMGGNVVLVRGENILRGSGLEINLVSGKSRLTAGNGENQRVRGIFSSPSNPQNSPTENP